MAPPPPSEIHKLLTRLIPQIPAADLLNIANFACDNVRPALLDAQGVLPQFACGEPPVAKMKMSLFGAPTNFAKSDLKLFSGSRAKSDNIFRVV